jgi:AcrR family transcriptional regulator
MVRDDDSASTSAVRSDAGRRRRPPGRPRDARLDQAILKAAERRLREGGYAGMSIEAVAREAQTTVPSLRRRYPDKPALAAAVIDSIRVERLPEPSGSPRDLALAILVNFRRNLGRRHTMALLGTLLAEERVRPELLGRFRERMVGPRRRLLREALTDGVRAGELDRRVDIDVAVNMLIGSFYAAYISDGRIPARLPERVLDQVWPASEVDRGSPQRESEI